MGLMDSLKGINRAKPGVPILSKEELLAKLLDLNKEDLHNVSWRAGVAIFSLEMEKFQGRTIGSKSFGIGYAFKGPDPLSFGKVYQYRFDVSEMKRPIIEIVTGSGWDFVPTSFK